MRSNWTRLRTKVHCERGNAYLSLPDYKKAVADFDKAIQSDSKNAAAYLGRGIRISENEPK